MTRSALPRVAAVLAAASLTLTTALAAAPGAGAAASAKPVSTSGAHRAVVAHHAVVPNSPPATSPNGAGYLISLAGVTSISARFTLPAFSCASDSDQEGLLPGIWSFAGGTVTGTQADFNLVCINGTATAIEAVCDSSFTCEAGSINGHAGDQIRVRIDFTPTSTTGIVEDLTQNVSAQQVGNADTGDTLFIGDVSPQQFRPGTPVPTFSNVVFTQVKVNGLPLADFESTRSSYASGSDVQIRTGNIRSDGKSFVTTFRHNT